MALTIIGVVVLIVAIILGLNYDIGPDRKSPVMKESNQNANTGNQADVQNYELIESNDKLILQNIDYNYQFSVPDDWPQFDPKNLSSVSIFSEPATTNEEGEIVQKGIQLYVHIEPADSNLSLIDNIRTFYEGVENYEEIEVGNKQAIRVNNINEVTDRTVFFLDEANDLMIQFDGFDLSGEEESDFVEVFDGIIDSVIIY